MSIATLLRIAAAVAAIQGIAHATLLLRAKPRHGPAEEAVLGAMKSNRFSFPSGMRSYWDFYLGYGLEAAAVCIVEAILFVLLARIAVTQPTVVRPILVLFVVGNLAHAGLTIRYFFYLPALFDLVLAVLLVWAFVAASR